MHSIQAEMERLIKAQKKAEKRPNQTEHKAKTSIAKTRPSQSKKSDRLEKVRSLQAEGLSPTEIAERLDNVSLRTVQRDLAKLSNTSQQVETS